MPSPNIFFSGGGNSKQSGILDRVFARTVGRSGRILYIPIAMPLTNRTYGQCFDWFTKTASKQGLTKVDMWTDLSGRSLPELNKYQAVYIGGGNTFYLMDSIRRTGFYKQLKAYIKGGGIVYGGSAGAIVLGKDIRTAQFGNFSDKNNVGLKNLEGFDLLNGLSIKCHYKSDNDTQIMKHLKHKKTNVLALPEETGVQLSGKNVKIIGYKDAYLFTNGKKIRLTKNSEFDIFRAANRLFTQK